MNSAIQNLQGFPFEKEYGVAFLTTPVRFLDTRTGQPAGSACIMPGAALTANTDTLYQVRSQCTRIPAGAKGIFGLLYVLNHSVSLYATMYPNTPLLRVDYSAQPYVKNRPFVATTFYNSTIAVVANTFISGIGADGKFWLYTAGTADFIIDITGYFL